MSEYLEIDGLRVTITDTAGQRDALDPVEQMGRRWRGGLEDAADLVIIARRQLPRGKKTKAPGPGG